MDEGMRAAMRLEVLKLACGNTQEAQRMWDWIAADKPVTVLTGLSQAKPGDVVMVDKSSLPFGCR